MDWGEFRVLYAQKHREALAATDRAGAIHDTRRRQAKTPAVGTWLTLFRRAPGPQRPGRTSS